MTNNPTNGISIPVTSLSARSTEVLDKGECNKRVIEWVSDKWWCKNMASEPNVW